MTGTDLIVLAPWIVFAAGLAVIGIVLLRSRRTYGPPRRPGRARANPRETRCPEKNAQAGRR